MVVTNIFQPLDLTVNGSAKAYMKQQFSQWYSQQIWKELEAGIELDDIGIKLTLTVLKPLHAKWIADLYDYLTSEKGAEIISNGWHASTISEAITKGSAELESLDPYSAIDPLDDDKINVLPPNDASISNETMRYFVSRCETSDDSDDDWEDENGSHISNIFDILDDEN